MGKCFYLRKGDVHTKPIALPPVGTALNDMSWEDVKNISDMGLAADYFAVGDTKSVAIKGTVGTLSVDTTLYVYIIGIDHNESVEGKGIHFGCFKTAATGGKDTALVVEYASSYSSGQLLFNPCHWGRFNYGGWKGCDLRYDVLGSTDKAPSGYGNAPTDSRPGYDASETCATNPVANTLMSALPVELRAVMKPIIKYTGNGYGMETEVVASKDYLPLLAEFEVYGVRSQAFIYEQDYQKQYDYFVAGNPKDKCRFGDLNATATWWLRSSYYGDYKSFCAVTNNDAVSVQNAFYSYGLAPAFAV